MIILDILAENMVLKKLELDIFIKAFHQRKVRTENFF